MKQASKRRVLVILGMHRSGTSLVASIASHLGAQLGDCLLPPQADNPDGFYEDVEVVSLNTELLQAIGADWHSVDELGGKFSASTDAMHAVRFTEGKIKDLLHSRLEKFDFWAFKDPRTLRTFPVWARILQDMDVDAHYLIVFRNPDDVCSSLARRDGMPAEQAALLWVLHYLEHWGALRKQKLAFIDYDNLLENPGAVMERVCGQLDLPWDNAKGHAVQESIKPTMNHAHAPGIAVWGEQGRPIRQFANRVYMDLRQLQVHFADPDTTNNLSSVSDLIRMAAPFLAATQSLITQQNNRWLLDQDFLYDRLAQALTGEALERAKIQRIQDGLRGEIAQIQRQLQTYVEALEALDRTYRNSTSWRITAPLRKLADLKKKINVQNRPNVRTDDLLSASAANNNLSRRVASSADYSRWIEQCEQETSQSGMDRLKVELESMSDRPLISVVMPTYKTPLIWLRLAIQSVLNQIYPNWELCIVDDASDDAGLLLALEEYGRLDARIRVRKRLQNGHISLASNDGVEMASGEIVTFLDHDDELAPHALYYVAKVFENSVSVQMAYSDEDMLNVEGVRYNPYFKSDLNRDLLLGQNMVTHLAAYRRPRLLEMGGFRQGFEGSQDYDLVLRYVENLPDAAIRHIPKILYHWRAIESSTASSSKAKPYAAEAGRRAVIEHLSRMNINATVVGAPGLPDGSTFQRVIFHLPPDKPTVSIIIPTKDSGDLLLRCLRSIFRSSPVVDYEIIIIDNGSTKKEAVDYLDFLRRSNPRVRVLRDGRPFNFSRLVNSGVQQAKGEIVCLLNNDTEVISADWLDELAAQAIRPGVGAVGAKLIYPDRTIQHAGIILGIGGTAGHIFKHFDEDSPGPFGLLKLLRNCSAVTGACLAIKRSTYLRVGGFDEITFPVAFNDVDFCLRVGKAGFRNVWTPYVEIYHHESATRGYEDTPEKKARFEGESAKLKERWGESLSVDPYYNVNLSRSSEDWSLRYCHTEELN
ncbi:glycosyltransferase [Thiomonas sp.]|uniref:glycosyltransferase n=1 Tax=Thiomonas sp. TaxID=2047785 RepID=UPI0025889858|nr:glycosyltransferase [Thiomonas sp.]